MNLSWYLSKNRIIDLQSTDFRSAISELLKTCKITDQPEENISIVDEIIEREKIITSYLDNGIAMPYIRRPINRPYIFAIGRCKNGLDFSNSGEHKDTQLIFFMVISTKNKESHLTILASIAQIFESQENIINIFAEQSISEFRDHICHLLNAYRSPVLPANEEEHRMNHLMFREAKKIARLNRCHIIFVFGDVLTSSFEIQDEPYSIRLFLVIQRNNNFVKADKTFEDIIFVNSFSKFRLSQIRSAIILALNRGIINHKDKICCFTGLLHSNVFDTISVIDIVKEFNNSFADNKSLIQEGICPEVLERLLTIAGDISIEGREGRSIGCLFVIGDIHKIKPYTKPLVLNPFYGYKEEDRNILNPFMAETIKEFSSIDGAFIVRGDGVIESAGTLIQVSNEWAVQTPSGFGSRHAAGAAISAVANCIAVVVSESTHQVTLFKDGTMIPFSDQSLSSSIF